MDINEARQGLQEVLNEVEKNKKLSDAGSLDEIFSEGLITVYENAIDWLNDIEDYKVIVPDFVAKWIEDADEAYGSSEESFSAFSVVSKLQKEMTLKPKEYEWLLYPQHQNLILRALTDGYLVIKEQKYRIKVKGICPERKSFLRYNSLEESFELAGETTTSQFKTLFSKEWLAENWIEYEAYNNAGLLEFEEVKDDEK